MTRRAFNLFFVSFGLFCTSITHLYAEKGSVAQPKTQELKQRPMLESKEVEDKLEINYNNLKMVLKSRGEGIRHKKFAMFNINVYKGKLFFLENFNDIKDPAVLLNSKTIAVKINPMRSFAGDKLKEAMTVSYEKNMVDPSSKAQTEFLDLISKHQIEKDQPVFLIGIVNKDNEELHLIMNDLNQVIIGSTGFVKEVFSVWLGEPVDADMNKLKSILTNY